MEWINIEDQEPLRNEMIIIDTDKGIAVAQYDGFGKVERALFAFVGVNYSSFKVTRWMPMPEK
ncbi:hypothetical protein [Rahnella aceris]|uniref:hypothetical protein n=1 Tax=Rahnella sp. (strain Y9602) TaxID=2703885 RepID=UPI0019053123|nr:hypothetical protein [Rahnella aceris]QQN35683.1 hypothetical protein JHW33_03285 [Rahnella aceris]UNK55602.1 hypothetical protein MNO10_23845 [Rahnella aceris]